MDIGSWIVETGIVVASLMPITLTIVRAAEKLGLEGKAQLIFALVVGGGMGAFASLSLFGIPGELLGWFQFVLFVVMNAGVPVGTYEVIKHAASKAQN